MLQTLGEQIKVEDRTVWAVFENAYTELDVGVDSTTPQITVRDIDIKGIPLDALAEVRGKKYTMVTREPDGDGMTVLRLSEA